MGKERKCMLEMRCRSVTGIRRSRGEMEVRKISAEFGGGFEKEAFFVSKHKGHYCGPIKAQHVAVNVRK